MCPLALFAEGTNGDDEDDDNDDDDDDDGGDEDDDVIIGHRFLPGSFLGLLVLHKLFPLFLWQGPISIIPDPDPYEIAVVFFSCFPMENKILCTPSFAHILDVLAVGLSGSVAGRLRRGQRLHREPGLRDGQLCTGSSYIST